jgi:hypothetical protein
MKVFISWSGKLSQVIGEAIKEWLPGVLQNVKPYFTPADIEKGSRWNADITKELEQSKLGIFIYTKDNLDSQWMLFEAGAISKTLDSSKVCPILFGLDNSDFKGPLTQFQTSQFNKIDFKKLVRTINNSLGDSKLEDKIFDEVFEMWWPKLETKINKILESNKVENIELRGDRELLEEILAITRMTAKRSIGITRPKKTYSNEIFEKLVSEYIHATDLIFSLDWIYTNECLRDHIVENFISKKGDFLNPKNLDEGDNWGNRPYFLNSYRKLKSFMEDNDMITQDSVFDDDLPF